MKLKVLILFSLILSSLIQSACFDRNNYNSVNLSVSSTVATPLSKLLKETLENVNDTVLLAFHGKEVQTSSYIKKFYDQNQNLPVWTTEMEPNHLAREMMRLFARSKYYGLDSGFYQFSTLKSLYYKLKDKTDPGLTKVALEYELLMTYNCFKIMNHMQNGVLHPDTLVFGRKIISYPVTYPQMLYEFINTDRLTEEITDLQPKSYEYRRLQKGLERFLNNSSLNEDSFFIPNPKTDSANAYLKTKEILIAYNYYNANCYAHEYAQSVIKSLYNYECDNFNKEESLPLKKPDSSFIEAIKKFQLDHGLEPDGKIGNNTRIALLKNNYQRFTQIAVNLERLKWENNRPSRYVYVNIPAYKLRVIDKYKIVKTSRIVVGSKTSETPLLNSQIEYFITNPTWNVPFSISSNELLPKLKSDSTYLLRHNFRIFNKSRELVNGKIDWSKVEASSFDYTIQQESGSGNALGKIKFIFPNPYNVYIHDTQDKNKFNKELRAYSHGCMRLEEPMEFAKILLSFETESNADSLYNLLQDESGHRINLKNPIPVFVRYITCEGNSNSEIIYYQDIYEKDQSLIKELFSNHEI